MKRSIFSHFFVTVSIFLLLGLQYDSVESNIEYVTSRTVGNLNSSKVRTTSSLGL